MLLGILFLSGLALIGLPGMLRGVGMRLEPSEWAGMSRLAMGTGWLAVELALVSQAAPTVFRTLGVTALADACEKMVGIWVPGGPVLAWAGAGAALLMPTLGLVGAFRARRTWANVHIEAGLGRRDQFEGFEVAVLPTDRAVAFSVHHRGEDQIVVSEGLLAELDHAEAKLVLRHEAAHLQYRHHRYLLFGAAIEMAFLGLPVARSSVAAMRNALERWADDTAAGTDLARRWNLRTALLGVADTAMHEPIAALWGSAPVADRITALEDTPARSSSTRRLVTYAPIAVVAFSGAAALGLWLGQLPAIVSMASCPLS